MNKIYSAPKMGSGGPFALMRRNENKRIETGRRKYRHLFVDHFCIESYMEVFVLYH